MALSTDATGARILCSAARSLRGADGAARVLAYRRVYMQEAPEVRVDPESDGGESEGFP